MTTELDPEILYAAALGATFAKMRAELDDASVKRILIFTLGRWGVSATIGNIERLPPARVIDDTTQEAMRETRLAIMHRRRAEKAEAQEAAPEPEPPVLRVTPPTNHKPIHAEACPICGKTGINAKGLNMHMFRAHGVTLKEHARMKALDTYEATP